MNSRPHRFSKLIWIEPLRTGFGHHVEQFDTTIRSAAMTKFKRNNWLCLWLVAPCSQGRSLVALWQQQNKKSLRAMTLIVFVFSSLSTSSSWNRLILTCSFSSLSISCSSNGVNPISGNENCHTFSSHRMWESHGLKRSTPPQNRHLVVTDENFKLAVWEFELTSWVGGWLSIIISLIHSAT